MFKVWNADAGRFAMNTTMCKRSAARMADALEAKTGDQHVLVRVS